MNRASTVSFQQGPFRRRDQLAVSSVATAALIWTGAILSPAHAADSIVFDTDTGIFTVNGSAAISIGGVAISDGGINTSGDNARRFIVRGDLNLNGGSFSTPGDLLTAIGSRPLDLIVGNNVNLGFNASINVSASGFNPGVGGGAGGSTSGFMAGGQGGVALPAATGGAGGLGSASCQDPSFPCNGHFAGDGSPGLIGSPNIHGKAGVSAPTGGAGGLGYNAASGAGAGGAGGIGGAATQDLPPAGGGPGGSHGADGGFPFPAANGGPGQNGRTPLFAGQDGYVGKTGGAGAGGANVPIASTMISGGAGGGAGGSGGGGGGGQSGAGGGGGGGGGGAEAAPFSNAFGGPGGSGGTGGQGGNGGQGGVGGPGGTGGGGGGAIEIHAAGRVFTAGQIISQGGNGTAGGAGSSGTGGTIGSPGTFGTQGIAVPNGGTGGAGGNGGGRSVGGEGGPGGAGNAGGSGSGGSVKINSTSLYGILGGGIDTAGGGGPLPGGNGRIILGVSTPDGTFFVPGTNNGTVVRAASEAPTLFNLYAAGGSYTPLVAPSAGGSRSMIGGASAYGLMPLDLMTSDPALAELAASHPTGATAFLELFATGTGPQGFENTIPGYDLLVFANFGAVELANAALNGVALQTFGFAEAVMFGGSGNANFLSGLDAGHIFATLVPDSGLTDFSFSDGVSSFSAILDTAVGGVIYNATSDTTSVPEPAPIGLLGLGLSAVGLMRRRRAHQ